MENKIEIKNKRNNVFIPVMSISSVNREGQHQEILVVTLDCGTVIKQDYLFKSVADLRFESIKNELLEMSIKTRIYRNE